MLLSAMMSGMRGEPGLADVEERDDLGVAVRDDVRGNAANVAAPALPASTMVVTPA